MAYGDQRILRDASGVSAIPQYYNPTTDSFEDSRGAEGASRVLLWDAAGSMALLTSSNPGYVKVQGVTADDTVASENPVLIGGKYSNSPTIRDEDDAVTLQMTSNGSARVALAECFIPDNEPIPVNLITSIDSDIDSIDVAKMSKGGITTAHNAITSTATSSEIDCRGYNAILVQATLSATYSWTFKVQGSMVSGGTFVDWYEQANTGSMVIMSYQCNSSRGFIFKGIPDWIKIVATKNADGATVTVKIQPLNV